MRHPELQMQQQPQNQSTSKATTAVVSSPVAMRQSHPHELDSMTPRERVGHPPTGEFGNLTNINVVSTAYNGCTQESLSVAATNNNQMTTFSYDGVGNVLNDTHNSYTWNDESQLKTAAGVTYTYDGDGERVQKSSGKIYWYGAGSEVLDESDASGNITDEYVYFGGKRISHRVVSTNALYFYGEDMLGTSRVIFTSAGVLCYDADFYPFGGERAYTNTCAQNYKFTGKERDSESGLDNFTARYFGSSLGRFMSPDLLGGHLENPQSLNKYVYVLNNPLSLTDPTGLDSYLQCQNSDHSGCGQETVGYDKNGNAQTAWVQGVTNADKSFTPTLIGNANPDGSGGLVDKTTGTGTYTASVNGSGVQFSNDGGKTSSTGVFDNGTPQTNFQDAGFANGGALSGFSFALTNSKLEANQAEAGYFSFAGTPAQAGAALQRAGFNPRLGIEGSNEYRSPGSFWTGANSGHFIVNPNILRDPGVTLPAAGGSMHFGEHNPYSPFGWGPHIPEAKQ